MTGRCSALGIDGAMGHCHYHRLEGSERAGEEGGTPNSTRCSFCFQERRYRDQGDSGSGPWCFTLLKRAPPSEQG